MDDTARGTLKGGCAAVAAADANREYASEMDKEKRKERKGESSRTMVRKICRSTGWGVLLVLSFDCLLLFNL